MRRLSQSLLLLVLLVAVLGCSNSAAQTDSGGIILSVSDFDGLPISISVSCLGWPGSDRPDRHPEHRQEPYRGLERSHDRRDALL